MIQVLPFLNNSKDLDLSYKMDLDLWYCLEERQIASYNRGNTVHENVFSRCIGTLHCISTNFTKGNNFCGGLISSLDDTALPK